MKRILEIGERAIQSITNEELASFLYSNKLCGTGPYWAKPEIKRLTELDDEDTAWFELTQKRSDGHTTISYSGYIFIREDYAGHYDQRFLSHRYNLRQIKELIKLGFNLPL